MQKIDPQRLSCCGRTSNFQHTKCQLYQENVAFQFSVTDLTLLFKHLDFNLHSIVAQSFLVYSLFQVILGFSDFLPVASKMSVSVGNFTVEEALGPPGQGSL